MPKYEVQTLLYGDTYENVWTYNDETPVIFDTYEDAPDITDFRIVEIEG